MSDPTPTGPGVSAFPSFLNERRAVTSERARLLTTSAEGLDYLAAHPSWRVRREVAQHRNTSEHTLRRLAGDSSVRVRIRVVVHPHLPLDVLDALALDPSPMLRMRVVGHVRARASTLLPMINGSFEGLMAQVRIQHHIEHRPGFDRDVLARPHPLALSLAARSSDVFVQREVAKASPSNKRDGMQPFRNLAMNPHLEPELQPLLARMTPDVQKVMCFRQDLLPDVENYLSEAPESIQIELAENPQLRLDTQMRFAKSKSVSVRRALASNENLSHVAHARLVDDDHWSVRCNALLCAHTTAKQVEKGLKADEPAVRCSAARSPRIADVDPERLVAIVTTLDLLEITHMADNPATPPDTLFLLVARCTAGPSWRFPSTASRWPLGVALGNPSLDPEVLEAFSDLDDLPAWAMRRLANNPSLPEERRNALLTWLALGGAKGDPTFDPFACTGHPGDPNEHAPYLEFHKIAQIEGTLSHPFHLVRASCARTAGTLPMADLERLAGDPHPDVRASASLYQPWNRAVKAKFLDDPNPFIRQRAASAKVVTLARKSNTLRPVVREQSNTRATSALIIAVAVGLIRLLSSNSDSTTTDLYSPVQDTSFMFNVLRDSTITSTFSGPQITIALTNGSTQLVAQDINGISTFCATGPDDEPYNPVSLASTSSIFATKDQPCRPGNGPASESIQGIMYDRAYDLLSPAPIIEALPVIATNEYAIVSDIDSTLYKLTFRVELTDYDPELALLLPGIEPIELKPSLSVPSQPFTVNNLHPDGLRPDISLKGSAVTISIPGKQTPQTFPSTTP